MPQSIYQNGLQVRMVWAYSGIPRAMQVHNYRNDAAVPVNQALANQVQSQYHFAFNDSNLIDHVSQAVTLHSVSIRDVSQGNMPEYFGTTAPVAGMMLGDPLPGQVALCVTMRTALAGRSYRGRSYFTGFTEGDSSGSTATQAACQAAVDFMDDLRIDMMSVLNLMLSVGSLFFEKERRPVGVLTPVTLLQSRQQFWETQRRRVAPGQGGQLYWGNLAVARTITPSTRSSRARRAAGQTTPAKQPAKPS